MIDLELVQEADQAGPGATLDHLASVIAETEVHSLLRPGINLFEDLVDRPGCHRSIFGISRDIGLINLEAGAGKPGGLVTEYAGQRHQERFEISVVAVQQGSRKHVGAGHGELEGSTGNLCRP